MTTDTSTILAYCATCNDDMPFRPVTRTETATIRGSEVKAVVNVLVCPQCGHVRDAPGHDSMLAFYNAYRRQEGLLTPGQIREIRERYDLSREAFARLLGMSPATLYRYEGGSLQDAAHDELIRSCEDFRRMVDLVSRRPERLTDAQRRKFEKAVSQPGSIWSLAGLALAILRETGDTYTTKLNKLLFYADFLAADLLGRPISGAPYVAIQHGPVPRDYDNLLEQMECNGLIERREVDHGDFTGTLIIACDVPFGPQLTPEQQQIVRHVAACFKDWTARKIRNFSHREDAWTQTPQKHVIDIRHAATLKIPRPSLHSDT